MSSEIQRQRLLQRCIELTDSLTLACGPPSEYAQLHALSEFWFDLDQVEQLRIGLHDLDLGVYAVQLWQESRRAETARAKAHDSTLRKIGSWKVPNHYFLMAAENGHRVGLLNTLKEIRRELSFLAGQPAFGDASIAQRNQPPVTVLGDCVMGDKIVNRTGNIVNRSTIGGSFSNAAKGGAFQSLLASIIAWFTRKVKKWVGE